MKRYFCLMKASLKIANLIILIDQTSMGCRHIFKNVFILIIFKNKKSNLLQIIKPVVSFQCLLQEFLLPEIPKTIVSVCSHLHVHPSMLVQAWTSINFTNNIIHHKNLFKDFHFINKMKPWVEDFWASIFSLWMMKKHVLCC